MILSIWEAAYRCPLTHWKSIVFPAPSHVLDGFCNLFGHITEFGEPLSKHWPFPEERHTVASTFFGANIISLLRLATGFAISLVLGTFLGVAMWRFKIVDEFLGPLFLGLQTLPSVCWAPLSVLIFGLDESGILFVLIMGSFFAIAIALRDGMRTIPPLYQRAGRMLGASGIKLYTHVLLPASLPAMASSLRQGFSFSWRSLMGAELMIESAERVGLGKLLSISRSVADSGRVVALMLIMVLIGMIADRVIFAPLQKAVQKRFGL